MSGTDNLEKGIRRGDADIALQAFARLNPTEREPFVERVGALFRTAVQSDFRAKNWSKLASWASRAEKIPGLEGVPDSIDFRMTQWCLTWGALKTKDWPRAQRLYLGIQSELARSSPRFDAAMSALTNGSATPEVVAPFAQPSSFAEDPRLGNESKRVRLEWTPPTHADETERVVLAMVGKEPWGVFATNLTQWVQKADAETGRRMLELAAGLATRETVRRLAKNLPRPGEPAELLKHAVQTLNAPASLEDETSVVFRLIAGRMSAEVTDLALTREFGPVAQAASAYPSLRPLVVAILTSHKFSIEAAGPVLQLLNRLIAQTPDPELVGRAMQLYVNYGPNDERASPPQAFLLGVQATLAVNTEGFGRWLDAQPRGLKDNLGAWMGFTLPVDLVRQVIVGSWNWASRSTRQCLENSFENVLVRLSEIHDLMDLDESALLAPLPAAARPLWNAVRPLILPEDASYLAFAIRETKDELPMDLVLQALGKTPSALKFLEVWEELSFSGYMSLANTVWAQLMERCVHDRLLLARAISEASGMRLPVSLKRQLAEAIRTPHNSPSSPDIEAALRTSQAWLKGKTAAKPKRKPKPKANSGSDTKAKTRKPKRSPPPDTDPLPF